MPFEVINFEAPYTADSLPDYQAGISIDLTSCWKLTPVDSFGALLPLQAVGATAHTKDLVLPGHDIVFKMHGGLEVTSVDTEAGQRSAGLDLVSVFTLDVTEQDIAKGIWNHALFQVFTVNYSALKMGQFVDFTGKLRKINSEGFKFKSEAIPLTEVYGNINLGRVFKHRCDVRRFADKYYENRCKLDPAGVGLDGFPLTVTGSVTTGGSNTQFTDSTRLEPAKHFENGVLRFTSGALNGVEVEIKSFAAGVFVLQLPQTELIANGVTYEAVRGCDRSTTMCSAKFGNIINYRGFPKIAGIEGLTRIQRANV